MPGLVNYDDFVFPEPWWDLRGHGVREAQLRDSVASELARELGRHHEITGAPVETIAMFTRQDEVLFRTGGEYLIVHLTWAGKKDRYVRVRRFSNWSATVTEIEAMTDW